MASPITLYVVPNCGLELANTEESEKGFVDYFICGRDRKAPTKYRVGNINEFPLANGKTNQKHYDGWMSPVNDLTLPRAIRRVAGVPDTARYFAYVHPPCGLAEDIGWDDFEMQPLCIDPWLLDDNKWALPYISMLGGYAYFDGNYQLMCVNALSILPTEYELALSGPFSATETACRDVQDANRVHPLTLEFFFELGIVASASIGPNEKFHLKNMTEDYNYQHGAFIFFKDDGSSLTYVIEPSGYIDPSGDTSSLADAFQSSRVKAHMTRNLGFVSKYTRTVSNISEIRISITLILEDENIDRAKSRLIESLQDKQTLIHKACQAGFDSSAVEKLLDDDEVNNLAHQDSYGWIPLQYACRFQSTNISLIQMLISKFPGGAVIVDSFNRSALHIACDSHTSGEVIDSLIEADKESLNITRKTKVLQRLPLHIAANDNCGMDVMSSLIHADPNGMTLSTKTKAGRLPLHMALEKKMEPEIIQNLLEMNGKDVYGTDTSTNNDIIEVTMDSSLRMKAYPDVLQKFKGLLPLHIACWNNSKAETVRLLLEKDENKVSIATEVGIESWLFFNSSQRDLGKKTGTPDVMKSISSDTSLSINANGSSFIAKKSTLDRGLLNLVQNKGGRTVALHLALRHGSDDVIDLLLREEKLRQRQNAYTVSTVLYVDSRGKTPLHVGCKYGASPDIIQRLLDLDHAKETTQITDEWGFKPIHYACDKHNADAEIVLMLVKAEEHFLQSRLKEGIKVKRSTHTLDELKRSPLYVAVKSGAPHDVIRILLQPEHFYLKGSDAGLVSGLAKVATSDGIAQELIMEKLSERCYFCLLFIDVYANSIALGAFLYASEKLIKGEPAVTECSALLLCLVIFILRALVQIKSQTMQYFADFWGWIQLTCIFLLARALLILYGHNANPQPDPDEGTRTLMILSGGFIIIQFAFFLRATFLPFARFVGGLIIIFKTLIPFFITSSLLLLMFAFGFRMRGDVDECSDLGECYTWVLQGFFSGADNTESILDIMFGIIAIVVLLNVVIAIVSEAWGSAAKKSTHLFWKFRLEFLSEARFFAYLDKRICKGGLVEKAGDYVDEIRDLALADHVPWSQPPYNLVTSKKEYDNPHDYYDHDLAQRITKGQSLQADLYWTKMDSKRKHLHWSNKRLRQSLCVLKWAWSTFLSMILLALGLLTAGWFWPKKIRKRILAVGLTRKIFPESRYKDFCANATEGKSSEKKTL